MREYIGVRSDSNSAKTSQRPAYTSLQGWRDWRQENQAELREAVQDSLGDPVDQWVTLRRAVVEMAVDEAKPDRFNHTMQSVHLIQRTI